MRNCIVLLSICLLFVSTTAYSGQKRVLPFYDIWSNKDSSAFQEEKNLIESLKVLIEGNEKIFSPSILHIKSKPEIVVLIASLGGDGEHTEEFSWVFGFNKSRPKIIAAKLPYFISNIWWVKPGESFGFTGEYIINFCLVCDGPDAAELEDIVSIPVFGIVSRESEKIEISSGKYSRDLINEKLQTLEKKHKKDISNINKRLQHAKELIEGSNRLF